MADNKFTIQDFKKDPEKWRPNKKYFISLVAWKVWEYCLSNQLDIMSYTLGSRNPGFFTIFTRFWVVKFVRPNHINTYNFSSMMLRLVAELNFMLDGELKEWVEYHASNNTQIKITEYYD